MKTIRSMPVAALKQIGIGNERRNLAHPHNSISQRWGEGGPFLINLGSLAANVHGCCCFKQVIAAIQEETLTLAFARPTDFHSSPCFQPAEAEMCTHTNKVSGWKVIEKCARVAVQAASSAVHAMVTRFGSGAMSDTFCSIKLCSGTTR
eukprot:6347524-Amphidinium_carterae.1